MLAWQLADQWLREYSTESIEDVLKKYFLHGLLHMTPDTFIVSREVFWDEQVCEIADGEPNAWFVELASSRKRNAISEFMRVATRRHKWCLWCRRGESRIRAYRWDKLEKKARIQ